MREFLLPPEFKWREHPKTKRDVLLNRLYACKTLIPGATTMPIEELGDYVDMAERKHVDHMKKAEEAAKKKAAMIVPIYADQLGAVREFLNWRRMKEGRNYGTL